MTPSSAPSSCHRLAVVLSHPTQYYSPWFRWLRTHTQLTFQVFYLWDFGVTAQRDPQFGATIKWDVDLLSGYDHVFVPNVANDPGIAGLSDAQLKSGLPKGFDAKTWKESAGVNGGYPYLKSNTP